MKRYAVTEHGSKKIIAYFTTEEKARWFAEGTIHPVPVHVEETNLYTRDDLNNLHYLGDLT